MAHAGVVSHSSSGLEVFFKSNGEIAVFSLGMAIQDLAIFTVLIRSRSRTVGGLLGSIPFLAPLRLKGRPWSTSSSGSCSLLSFMYEVPPQSEGHRPAGPHLVVLCTVSEALLFVFWGGRMCFPVRSCGFLRASYGVLPLSFLRLPLRRRVPGQTDVFSRLRLQSSTFTVFFFLSPRSFLHALRPRGLAGRLDVFSQPRSSTS